MENLRRHQKHTRDQKANDDGIGNVHSVVPTMSKVSCFGHSNMTERRDRTPFFAAVV
jgi:hypothetical protein